MEVFFVLVELWISVNETQRRGIVKRYPWVFPQVDGGSRTPGFWDVTQIIQISMVKG